MHLYDIIKEQNADRVFIAGMAKNAGKTSTLNHLINASALHGERLGLTSTGRDGEPLDLVTGKAKPHIFCPKGTIIATAQSALRISTATLRDPEPTGIHTPLGEVIIAEVAHEGNLELAGPLYAKDLEYIMARMAERGATRIYVDGSLDRKAAALVLDKIILAVGAVVSPDLDTVVNEAATWVGQLTILAAPPWVGLAISKLPPCAGGLILPDKTISPFPFPTLLGRGHDLTSAYKQKNAWGIYLNGALGEETFASILSQNKLPRLVIRNSTCLFVTSSQWRQFKNRGGEIYATHPLSLLAVSANPFSPEGWEFIPEEFLGAIKDALPGVPVINPGPWVMNYY
ncbi:lysine 5,6-aminomutase reactivase subunit KamB [Dethiobacter alkaliphilus]|uniref:lysine 5,6-aminomutase reactivase subunit KamB n=1 Tax=Dethiobacter alkaliphilus TaxID=427926 RepID=UPI002227A897|nr:hypothetical protein [Dethiobacter alkaliphilus]MCW3490317.1 hypothetical protein [Dethiobacter alkaliphilus]